MFKAIKDLFTPNDELLIEAVNDGSWRKVRELIKAGTKKEIVDSAGRNLLLLAALGNHVEVVKVLLEVGLREPMVMGKRCTDTLLHWAAGGGHLEVVEYLLTIEVDKDAKDTQSGNTPLYEAADNGHAAAVAVLVKAGANVNAKGKYGRTPLHLSAAKGDVNVATYLITAGANLDAKCDLYGETPLHSAAKSRNACAGVAAVLVKAGANKESKDKDGKTPLELAIYDWYADHIAVLDVLVRAGAKINEDKGLFLYRDKETSRSDVASGEYHTRMAKILLPHMFSASGVAYLLKHNGDIGKLKALAQERLDVLQRLHYAAAKGDVVVVERLVKAGENKEAQDKDGNTPLLIAAEKGHVGVVECLVKAGVNLEAQGRYGSTPLQSAAGKGHIGVVKYLHKAGANIETTKYGYTLLHSASSDGHLEVVEYLVNAGAKLEAIDSYGQTPLHLSAEYGHAAVVEFLVKAGASVQAENKYNKTPFQIVSAKGHADIVKMLLPYEQLFEAADKGDDKKVQELIADGVNINVRGKNGCTPLHSAAWGGHAAAVELLVKAGAEKEAKEDKCGETPLHHAANRGNLRIVELLVKARTDKEATREDGNTPLHNAAWWGHTGVVEYLLKVGANKDAKNNDGKTPLHLAASKGCVESIGALLKVGANKEVTNKEGKTPLQIATEKGHTDIVQILLKHNPSTAVQEEKTRKEEQERKAQAKTQENVTNLVEAGPALKSHTDSTVALSKNLVSQNANNISSAVSAMKDDEVHLILLDPSEEKAVQMQEINNDMRCVDYYDGFKAALSKAYITARKIVNKEFIIDEGNAHKTIKAKTLSLMPFCGNMPGNKVEDVVAFIQSARCQKDVQKFIKLVPDENMFAQMIDKMAREIVLRDRTKNIFVQNKAAAETSSWFKMIGAKCKAFGVELADELFEEHYESAEAKLGYKDACSLIDMWISGKIVRSEDKTIERSLVDAIVAPQPIAQTECTVMMVSEVKYDNPLLNYWLNSGPNALKDLEKVCGHEMVMWLIDCCAASNAAPPSGNPAMDNSIATATAHEATNMGEIVYHE